MKLKLYIKDLENKLQISEQRLTQATDFLTQEIQKHQKPEPLSAQNINDRLALKGQEILTKVKNEFGDILLTLQSSLLESKISFRSLDITGSQVYMPVLKMTDQIKFKDDREPQDLDLRLVIADRDFAQHLQDKHQFKQLITRLLPGFKMVGEPHLAPNEQHSASIKLKYGDKEIDLNIYGERFYEKMSQWQFNGDRLTLGVDGKFAVNNNEATNENMFGSCQEFLLAIQENPTIALLHNPAAKGFLNRILRDCGHFKLTPATLEPVMGKLIDEMAQILTKQPKIPNWDEFRQNYCSELIKNNRIDEMAMVRNIHYMTQTTLINHQQERTIQSLTYQPNNPPSPHPQIRMQQLPNQLEIRRSAHKG